MAETDKLTEEKIFEAATEVFIERGMDGTRMQEIANRAGINKSLLHYYYRTKERLFNAVFEKITGELFKKFKFVFDEKITLEDKIRLFYKEHITFLLKNPKIPSFVLNEINHNPERSKKLIRRLNIDNYWNILEIQHKEEFIKYNITRETLPQLITSIAALSVFPFAARGIIEGLFEKSGIDFDDYMEKRKEYAAEFVIRAIRK